MSKPFGLYWQPVVYQICPACLAGKDAKGRKRLKDGCWGCGGKKYFPVGATFSSIMKIGQI